MNILMLGWELPPYNSGGLGVACYHMAKALAYRGTKIDFVVPHKASYPDINFMKVRCATDIPLFDFGSGAYSSEDIDNSPANNMRQIQKKYIKYVEKLVTKTKPDVIHAHDWLTMEAGTRAKALTGAPLIVHVHATEFDRSGGDRGNPLVHEIEYEGLVMADRIIAVSNITKDIIVSRYKIPADKIEVVHNGFDVMDLDDGYVYDKRSYKYLEALKQEGYTIVATMTRFTVQKGLTHFIRAAARASEKYDKLAFLIAGDGEQKNELIELAADLGIADKIFFTGFVRGKQWRDTYSAADMFIMSSVSEPFGLTALEAAHHGNALSITYQSGVGEVLRSVFRYDFWDEDRLADQIVGVAASQALKSSMQQNVQEEYGSISWNDVAKNCMHMYETMSRGLVI